MFTEISDQHKLTDSEIDAVTDLDSFRTIFTNIIKKTTQYPKTSIFTELDAIDDVTVWIEFSSSRVR